MKLRWRPGGGAGVAPNLYGFTADERLVAQVVKYDRPAAWKAYVRGYPISGSYHDAVEGAQREAEAHLALSPDAQNARPDPERGPRRAS